MYEKHRITSSKTRTYMQNADTRTETLTTAKRVLNTLLPIVWDVLRKTLINILNRKGKGELIS